MQLAESDSCEVSVSHLPCLGSVQVSFGGCVRYPSCRGHR